MAMRAGPLSNVRVPRLSKHKGLRASALRVEVVHLQWSVRGGFLVSQGFAERLAVGELDVVTVWVGDDAKIACIRIEVRRTELKYPALFCFRRNRVHFFSRIHSKAQVTERPKRQLRFCSGYNGWRSFLQHHHKTESAFFVALTQPNDFHSGAGCIRMAVRHAKIGVTFIKFDAGFQAFYV